MNGINVGRQIVRMQGKQPPPQKKPPNNLRFNTDTQDLDGSQ